MAEVFNAFDRQNRDPTSSRPSTTSTATAAKRIRQLMFTFEDLTKLDAASAQTLIRQVTSRSCARRLKGSPEPVRAFFLGNMSSRAAKNLNEEMESLGPIRIKDVDEAQLAMVNLAKELADKGDIMISKNNAEEELIY